MTQAPEDRPPLGWCWHGYNLDEDLCPMCDMVEIALLDQEPSEEDQ